MNRRSFLSAAGLLPLAAALPAAADPLHGGAAAGAARPMSRAASRGYLPNVPLVAHTGETFNFYDDLVRDRIILLNFFVVQCPEGRCPAANQNLRKVQDMLGERMGKDVFFYSVTLEPEKDTVPVLKEYAEDIFEVKPGWLFLTGKARDVELLRRSQGFVDPDPERDRDVSNHSSSGRLIVDNKESWSMVALGTSPRNIYSVIRSL
ncbi:MAG: SCO family protein [Proteobacteria bacterium]|nr:SCO family protein [Pseudomonadota bacterium]